MPAVASAPSGAATRERRASPYVVRLLLLAGVTAGIAIASLMVGASEISPGDVLEVLAGGGEATARTIVLELRLPRTMLALIVGGALALAGAVFQALLRNPLAEPYILGVSGGAAIGAVTAMVFLGAAATAWTLPAAAFAGAVVSIALVFRIASGVGRTLDPRVLLLAGVMVGAFFNAAILLLLTTSDTETFRSAIFWMMGSLSTATWPSVSLLFTYFLPSSALLLLLARPLNLLAVGEETALYLGIRVERVKRTAYVLASLLVGASVAVAGVIGFIGLVMPHALRMLWGADHRLLLPGSVLAGGAFLLAADTVARTIAAPAELPVGVVTALVGVPIFVALLTRAGRS